MSSNIKLSVIMPVFNEAATVRQIVDTVLAVPVRKELIIVDDCSTDGTRSVLNDLSIDPEIRIILADRSRGREPPCALDLQRRVATFDIQDADLEYDPQETQSS